MVQFGLVLVQFSPFLDQFMLIFVPLLSPHLDHFSSIQIQWTSIFRHFLVHLQSNFYFGPFLDLLVFCNILPQFSQAYWILRRTLTQNLILSLCIFSISFYQVSLQNCNDCKYFLCFISFRKPQRIQIKLKKQLSHYEVCYTFEPNLSKMCKNLKYLAYLTQDDLAQIDGWSLQYREGVS